MPGFALRMSLWDVIGTASYTLAFALLESLVILFPLVLLAIVLPARLFKNHFVAFGSVIVLISSAWMMFVNYQRVDLTQLEAVPFLVALEFYLVSIALPLMLIARFHWVEQRVQAIIARVAVLAYVYVGLGAMGILIVLLRNL